jgi:hypothetical protein
LAMAVTDAIRTNRETIILTKDEGMLEQFYKLLWFLDMHYRAMLLADRYKNDPLSFQPVERIVDEQNRTFEGDVILLKRSADLLEVLPARPRMVAVHCILLRTERTWLTFNAEQHMAGLLDIKGKKGGLSTDLFDGRNCHVLLPTVGNRKKPFAGIAKDVTSCGQGWKSKLAINDINLSLAAGEQFTRIRELDPRVILLPRDS